MCVIKSHEVNFNKIETPPKHELKDKVCVGIHINIKV